MTSSMSNTGYSTSWFDNTPGTLARIDDDVRKYGDMIKGAELRIRELRVRVWRSPLEDNEKRIKMRDEFIKMNKKQLETWLADEKMRAASTGTWPAPFFPARRISGGSSESQCG